MAETEKSAVDVDLQIPDIVITKNDAIFWNAMDGGQEMMKKAGTRCVVADVIYKDGIPNSVIIEDYDQKLNIAWLASLGADEVKRVWKSPR